MHVNKFMCSILLWFHCKLTNRPKQPNPVYWSKKFSSLNQFSVNPPTKFMSTSTPAWLQRTLLCQQVHQHDCREHYNNWLHSWCFSACGGTKGSFRHSVQNYITPLYFWSNFIQTFSFLLVLFQSFYSFYTLKIAWSRVILFEDNLLSFTCTCWSIYPFRTKTPKYLFPRGNEPLLYHQIGNRNFFIFITNQ